MNLIHLRWLLLFPRRIHRTAETGLCINVSLLESITRCFSYIFLQYTRVNMHIDGT